MVKINNFFLLVLLTALLGQSVLWHKVTFTDEALWAGRVRQLANDWQIGDHVFDQRNYSEHPGTPVLMLAAGLYLAGVPARSSLTGAVAVIVSIIIASIVTLLRQREERAWWWLATGVITTTHPLYLQASPVDAVIAPLVVVMTVLVLVVLEDKLDNRWRRLGLTTVIGLALSTRLHFTLIFIVPVIIALVVKKGWKYGMGLVVGSGIVAWATNPLLWYSPLVFLRAAFIDQLGFFSGSGLAANSDKLLALEQFVIYAPWTLISIALFLGLFVFRRRALVVDKTFAGMILVCTGLTGLALTLSQLQSLRYYFPLFFLWESFLPWWLWQAISNIKFYQIGRWHSVRVKQAVNIGIIILLVTCQVIIVFYIYYLPTAVIAVNK